MPTTHDSSVSADRMLLLYAMLAGLKINVGKLIVDEIYRCSMKKTGQLFYSPSSSHDQFSSVLSADGSAR